MKKHSIDHVAKLLAGTSVVVVSSLLAVAPASADTPDAKALHARTEQVSPINFSVCEGTCCRVAVATTLHESTEQVSPISFSVCEGTCCRVAVAATLHESTDNVGEDTTGRVTSKRD
jgi:tRNA A37 threonylcarbamoyladenosine modification protein TsaB